MCGAWGAKNTLDKTRICSIMRASMAIRVFISYSHDSSQHSERVWELSERLRSDGIDCRIDQHETWPEDGWPNWCKKQIKESNFVLVVCTATYLRRYEGNEEAGTGRGVKWEGFVITQELYEAEGKNKKFIPLVLVGEDKQYIPVELRAYPKYIPSEEEGYNELFRTLTNQPERRATPVAGAIRKLPTLMGKRDKKAAGTSTASSSLPALPQIERKQDFSESGNGENGESRAYDVFLSHFEVDAAVVGVLGKRLTEEAQLRVWLDKWRSIPGTRYDRTRRKGSTKPVSCAICLSKNTPRPWFDQQIGRALNKRSKTANSG